MYIQFNILQLFYTMTELKNQSLFSPQILVKLPSGLLVTSIRSCRCCYWNRMKISSKIIPIIIPRFWLLKNQTLANALCHLIQSGKFPCCIFSFPVNYVVCTMLKSVVLWREELIGQASCGWKNWCWTKELLHMDFGLWTACFHSEACSTQCL